MKKRGFLAHGVTQLVLMPGNQGAFVVCQQPRNLQTYSAGSQHPELGLVITPEFGGIAELEPETCCITYMLALDFDFVSQNAQLFTHQLFHQISLEIFATA